MYFLVYLEKLSNSCLFTALSVTVMSAELLSSAVMLVDAASRFQCIVCFCYGVGHLQPKILDRSRQSFNRNQNNEWLSAKFNMESLRVAIS